MFESDQNRLNGIIVIAGFNALKQDASHTYSRFDLKAACTCPDLNFIIGTLIVSCPL